MRVLATAAGSFSLAVFAANCIPLLEGALLPLSCVLAALCAAALLCLRGRARVRGALICGGLALGLLCGPLLFVTPIGPRNFLPPYVLLSLIALLLYREAREQGLPGLTRLAAPLSALALAGLVWVYSCNCLVYHQRLSYAREQAAGAESITLPLLPYDQWAINETVWKGDISYLVYREVPWDVAFTFVPWAEYTAP